MNPTTKVATVSTLKTSLQITLSFVRFHLNAGIDHMYLFFDDPNDEAIPYLESESRVDVIKCDNKHWKDIGLHSQSSIYDKQEANATLAFQLARNSGFDWIIHLDSDELIYGPTSISQYLSSISKSVSVLNFQVMEALPQGINYENPFTEINYFKVHANAQFHPMYFKMRRAEKLYHRICSKSWRMRIKIARQSGSKHASVKNYVLGHIKGKSAVRTAIDIDSLKPHFPIPKNGHKPIFSISKSFRVLHYDCLGFESWKIKWMNRVQHNLWTEVISTERLNLHNKIKTAFEREGGAESLYKELYHLNSYERMLLKSVGLLKEIKIEKNLFEIVR